MANEDQAAGERALEIPNVWALSGEGRNPYLHNVFVLLGIDPDNRQDTYDDTVSRLAVKIEQGVEVVVHGRKVELTDVSRAEGLARKPSDFVAERLLVHTVHKVNLKQFNKATQAIEAIRWEAPETLLPLALCNLSFLMGLLPEPADLTFGTAGPVAAEQLQALFVPSAADERLWDL